MSSIGNIIKRHRLMNNMSRKELSEGICTEKYIYLIETDKRNPSANILKLLSSKLQVDLFSYYEYLDCADPISVKKYMEEFLLYRAKFEPQLLYETTIEAMKLPDFNKKPWSFEIQINVFFRMVYVDYDYEKTIIEINKFLEKMEVKYSKGEYAANAYVLLSVSYTFLGDLSNAKRASQLSYDIMDSTYKTRNYGNTITNITINNMGVSYLLGEYDTVIREAKEMLNYKFESGSYDRMHYCYFYSAFAYEKMGAHHEAMENFKKGIYISLVDYIDGDIKYVTTQDVYPTLINDEGMCKGVVNEFKKKYNVE